MTRRKSIITIALVAALAAGFTTPAQASPRDGLREYIVTTTPSDHAQILTSIANAGGAISTQSSDSGLIRATFNANTAATIDALPGASVATNRIYRTTGTVTNPVNPSLDRIDQRQTTGDSRYSFPDKQLGAGVSIYILDSGVQANHPQFTGRVQAGASFVNTVAANGNGPGNTDCGGHGTHVAGIAAGDTTGVAPKAMIVPVRIFGCANDAPADSYRVLTAIDWVIDHHKAGTPAVINMSIGSERDPLMADAIDELIADGITVVVAAGNETKDACSFSPANVPAAITVGAMSSGSGQDVISRFSNFGSCVDIFAPGGDFNPETRQLIDPIISANAALLTPRSGAMRGDLHSMIGTSQASPFVAGAAARYLAANPSAQPDEVAKAILSAATLDPFADAKGSPNRLLYLDPAGFTPVTSGTPSAPTAVKATAVAETAAVAVSWTAPATGKNASPITGYTVTATTKGSAPVTAVAAGAATSLVVEGLQINRSYRFSVTAQNTTGGSPKSVPTNPIYVGKAVTQPAAALPDEPTNLTATNVADNVVALTWADPASDGGSPILMYLVEVTPEVGVLTHSVKETQRKVNKFDFFGLNAGVTYTFTVYTLTSAGISRAGAVTTATPAGKTIDLPRPSEDIKVSANNGYLTVQWLSPKPASETDRPITSWQVSLIEEKTNTVIEKLDVRSGPDMAADFSRAKAGEKYKVAMTAVSGPIIGYSTTTKPFTMSKTLTMGSAGETTTPTMPAEKYIPALKASPKSIVVSKTVTVEWTPPKKVAVQKYYISWQPFNDPKAAWSTKKTVSGKAKRYVITDMPEGEWMLRIETVTKQGKGLLMMKVTKTP